MNKVRAILVDDEEAARNVLEQLLLRNCPEIEVIKKCQDVPSAAKAIESFKPDLVFLDVEMPNYAGYELIEHVKERNFEIIFITAYDQYAIKAFELNAVEYLVKPIHRERLMDAVKKFRKRQYQTQLEREYELLKGALHKKEFRHLVISELGNKRILELKEIIAFEARGAYSQIHLSNDPKGVLASKNLKHFEGILPDDAGFFRSHKTWLINMEHVQSYSISDLSIGLNSELTAKLSRFKKAEFEELLKF